MEQVAIEDCTNTLLRIFNEAKASGKKVDAEFINTTIEQLKLLLPQYKDFSDEDWKTIKFKIETSINVEIDEGPIILANPRVERWLDHKRGEIDWNYWKAYKEFLLDQGRSLEVIKETEKTIDEILDCSGDPQKEGKWNRRGLVMGNVQSGKTQNYLGLLNKAIDAGYKVIIVLGGHLNELRTQTQERLDEGVIGKESKKRYESGQPIGVGKYRAEHLRASFLTTTEGDFKKSVANSFGIHFSIVDGAIIFVIKKWASVLNNLSEWIAEKHDLDVEAGQKLDHQLLLIDDEADYASINTKHEKGDITAINNNIRKLLALFNRSTYIGYTATPFANIFIDPDEEHVDIGDDLFPEDFMIRIPTPDSYVGQKHFFQSNDDSKADPVVIIDDNEVLLPAKSNKETPVGVLPESLKEAIRCYLITVAVRSLRGTPKAHSTMLINMTHLTLLQNKIAEVVDEYMDEIRSAADFAMGYSMELAVKKSRVISDIKDSFYKFYEINESFEEIFNHLKRAIGKTKVFAVHGKSGESLDYSAYKANGLSAIVIGGHKLSRGLTLEGLTISYFTRNSKTYDTLMQMCRWFGYRPGYKDLCKLFITEESFEWYEFISNAIDELYLELERMSEQKKTPGEFGLKVREHPGALLITAKQKMNAAHSHTRSLDLAGRRLRKYEFYVSDENNLNNLNVTRNLINRLFDEGVNQYSAADGSTIFYDVDHSVIKDFISDTKYVEGEVTDDLLLQYISKLEKSGLPKFTVCIKNIKNEKNLWWSQKQVQDGDPELPSIISLDHRLPQIKPSKRKLLASVSGNTVCWERQEIGDKHDERYFLQDPDNAPEESNPFYYITNPERNQPGLIIYTLSIGTLPKNAKKGGDEILGVPHKDPTISYSVSFPLLENLKGKSKREIDRLSRETKVSYVVNQIWKALNEDLVLEYEDDDE
ncbi:Z1 domain-containing protein [Thalassotalea marina]|uniref:Endonuclease n=1 Tax=Thalassotalea marina TaxID=1673741 RepID=A0A919BGR3_9GAMM|nr:Z1 domain-containing protein [Thalassotalea marina]GHF88137.1 endonuclease [Thalassotalea marina]